MVHCDAIFIRGGDQGVYYDQWNGTALEDSIRAVILRQGAIGGTSAGAMSLAEFCLSGGKDLISLDVLQDARTSYLEDASEGPGSSGIHSDFLSLLPGFFVDTHFTERGRLGRTIGVLAKAMEDAGRSDLRAIGLEQKTGVVIRQDTLHVYGTGEVSLISPTSDTQIRRTAKRPLWAANLRLDRLTHGWKYVLSSGSPVTLPLPDGMTDLPVFPGGQPAPGPLQIDGSQAGHQSLFAWSGAIYPANYSLMAGSSPGLWPGSAGFTDASASSSRADKQETLFRVLYDKPAALGVLAFRGSRLEIRTGQPDRLMVTAEPGYSTAAAIFIDLSSATQSGLSPFPSNWATSGGSLKTAAFINARLHVLADSDKPDRGVWFDLIAQKPEGGILTTVTDDTYPSSFEMGHPYPNPANPVTRVPFRSSKQVTLTLTDLLGRQVQQWKQPPGSADLLLDLSGFATGVYLLHATDHQAETVTRRVILLR